MRCFIVSNEILSDDVGVAVTERYAPLKRAPCFLSDARSEKFTSINKRNKWKCKKRFPRRLENNDFYSILTTIVSLTNMHIRFNSRNDLFELLRPQIFVYWNIILFLLYNQLFAGFCFLVLQFNIILISFIIRTDEYCDNELHYYSIRERDSFIMWRTWRKLHNFLINFFI